MKKVKLLGVTPNAKELIYLSMRQCYMSGWVGDCNVTGNDIYDKNWKKIESKYIDNLITKVVDSGHTSPLDHVQFTFAIEGLDRAETHQLVRHKIGCNYSHQSQRYTGEGETDEGMMLYCIPDEIKGIYEAEEIFEAQMKSAYDAFKSLKEVLEKNGQGEKSKEVARSVLPNATETKIVVTMTVRALINFFRERLCFRAQKPIRTTAKMMYDICKEELPIIFNNVGSKCVMLGYCPEAFQCKEKLRPKKEEVLEVYKLFKKVDK